jgi:hypothetical protein
MLLLRQSSWQLSAPPASPVPVVVPLLDELVVVLLVVPPVPLLEVLPVPVLAVVVAPPPVDWAAGLEQPASARREHETRKR